MPAFVDQTYYPNGESHHSVVVNFTLTVGADGTAQDVSDADVVGEVVRVELYSANTVANGAVIRGYEVEARAPVGSRNDFLSYTKAGAGQLAVQIRPAYPLTTITGSNIDNVYVHPFVAGLLMVAISGDTPGNVHQVRVYVRMT